MLACLQWLPVAVRIEFKICVLTYQSWTVLHQHTFLTCCSQSLHFNVKLICTLRQILNSLCRVLVFELVKELSVQHPLAYGMLYGMIKQAATLLIFIKKLETFLFSKHLC